LSSTPGGLFDQSNSTRQCRATNSISRGLLKPIPRRSTASPIARYIAPVSRKSNPSREATSRDTVLLPVPAGPSMVITMAGC
jgi:hypothetical protein